MRATFDTLDFDVLTVQKWDRLRERHSADVIVHWPMREEHLFWGDPTFMKQIGLAQ